jgi:hypothetical protein
MGDGESTPRAATIEFEQFAADVSGAPLTVTLETVQFVRAVLNEPMSELMGRAVEMLGDIIRALASAQIPTGQFSSSKPSNTCGSSSNERTSTTRQSLAARRTPRRRR